MKEIAHDELPPGWAEAPMLELATTITKGSTPTTYGHDYKETGISFVRVESLADGRINREALITFIDESAHTALRRSQLQAGDILYSIAGTIGRTALVREQDLPANTNQALAIIRGTDTVVIPSYLIHFLSSSSSQQRTLLKARGGAMNNISLSDIEKIVVPVAPRAEQKRMVEEIDKQLTRLDAAVAALRRVRANLKRYRAAVLKAACEGRLVPTEAELARREGHSYEPASVLLERILTERRSRWEADQLAKSKALKVVPKDNSWKAKYPQPVGPDTKEVGTAPEGWAWASPEQIASPEDYSLAIGPFGSNLKVSDYKDSGTPLVFVRNIRTHNYVDDLKYVSPEKAEELRPHRVAGGDILITKMGDPPGDSSIYPKYLPSAVITADCIKFRLTSQVPSAEFFVYAIRSDFVHSQILSITKGVAQLKVSLSRFRSIALPLPPLREQERITEVLERKFATITKLESEVTAALLRAGRLRQAILNRAFTGTLVPQDPSDEPASVLLERIYTERNAQAGKQMSHKSARKLVTQ